jgi:hypothetical protein
MRLAALLLVSIGASCSSMPAAPGDASADAPGDVSAGAETNADAPGDGSIDAPDGSIDVTNDAPANDAPANDAPMNDSTMPGSPTCIARYLETAQDLVADDIAGGTGFTATWQNDSTGGFALATWPRGGAAGLRWTAADSSHAQLYVRFDLRRTSSTFNTKQLKIFGWGLVPGGSRYSNFTFGPQVSGYGGGLSAGGVAYSDSIGGGDNSCSPGYGGYTSPPSTGYGGSFSRTPYPTQAVVTGGVTQAINDWDTWEVFVRYNDDGTPNGEIAVWKNHALIFHYTNMFNCGTGLQHIGGFWLGGYTSGSNGPYTEHYRRVCVSYDRPASLP